MKHLIILLVIGLISTSAFTQKVAKVTITTTDSIATALKKCIDAGKVAKYGSKDLDINTGKVTL